MLNESNENSDFLNDLNKSYADWNPDFESENLWEKISQSIAYEEDFEKIKTDYEREEIILPAQIWNNLKVRLENESIDNKLVSDFNSWNLSPNETILNQIKESVEIEKVWDKLNLSIDKENKLRNSALFKILIACTLLFFSFYTSDQLIKKSKFISQASFPNSDQVLSNKLNQTKENSNDLKDNIIEKLFSSINSNDKVEQLVAIINVPNENDQNSIDEKSSTAKIIFSSKIEQIPILQNSIFKINDSIITTKTNVNSPKKISIGLDYFTTIAFLQNNKIQNLTTNLGGVGYEFGVFLRHDIRKFSQEYIVNYSAFNQTENTFDNGKFAQNKYYFTGLKINTFTTFPILNKFNVGAGLSAFTPFTATKMRANTIIDLPKMNPINIGFNVGVEYNFQSKNLNHFNLNLKYESLFSTNNKSANFKLFQNYNLGLKYIF